MKKIKNILFAGLVTAVLGVGVAVSAHQEKAKVTEAATETTVYYAVPSEIVGSYTVKLNINRKGDGEDWMTYDMTKLSDTYGGYDLYSYTYTDLYDGVGVMQFQLFEGSEWRSQQQPIGSWTTADYYNGKVYVHDDGWHEYTPGMDTYIPMRTSFFTNWVSEAGSIRPAGSNCWNNKSLNALAPVFDGCLDHEGWTGTLTTEKWHQTTPWIYFEYGCANNSHVGEATDVKLVFKLWASKDAAEPSYTHDFHNDTFSQTTLLLRNFEVPSAEYEALGGDFYMSIDLVDGRGNDYGANEFGYLHVNQTHQQVSDAQWYYYTQCVEGEAASVLTLRNHYRSNGSLRNGFVYSVGFEESFDTQASFDANWVKDIYGNDEGERHQDRVISESTYRNGGKNLPFNNTNGFFKGWYGGANDDYEDHVYGYTATDGAIYRFISKPFIMPANGIVSVKMAGNGASLHLLDFESTDDLAWVDCRTFVSNGDDHLVVDGDVNVCTMVNHVINFSKYAGRKVQIGIADVADGNKSGGWQAAYFDELKANYTSLPSFALDVVEQDDGTKTYAVLPDYYVNAVEGNGGVDYALDDGPAEDVSPLFAAHPVWKNFIDAVRGGQEGVNVCSVLTSDEVKDFLGAYNVISNEAKAIVCTSEDFQRIGEGSWQNVNPTIFDKDATYNLGHTIQYLGELNHIEVVVYAYNRIINPMTVNDNVVYIVVIIAAIASLSFMALFIIKKHKKQK